MSNNEDMIEGEGEIGNDEEVNVKIEIGEVFLVDGLLEEDGMQSSDPVCPFPSGKVEVKMELSDSESEPESEISRQKRVKRECELARLRIEPGVKDPLGTFECGKCGLEFVTQKNLEAHKRESHSRNQTQNENPIKSEDQDLNSESENEDISCDLPHLPRKKSNERKRTKRKRFLSKHLWRRVYKCTFCKENFRKVNHLKNHIFLCHSNEKGFSCRVEGCDRKFFHVGERAVHEIKVHRVGGKDYKCPQCPEWKGLTKAEFNQHSSRVHPTEKDIQKRASAAANKKIPCTHCRNVFKSVTELKNHFSKKHSSLLPTELKQHCAMGRGRPSAGDNPRQCIYPYQYPCTYSSCKIWFGNAQELKNHISEKHSGEPGMCCRVEGCSEKFLYAGARSHHEIKVHRVGGKNYKCSQCPEWSGLTRTEFNQHSARVHPTEEDKRKKAAWAAYMVSKRKAEKQAGIVKERNLSCDSCGKNFARSCDLRLHQTIHTGVKLYKCTEPDCNKSFNQKGHLEGHINSEHKGEKPFQCEFCERSCASKHLLNNHVRNVHCAPEDKKFACQHCDLKFGTNTQLKNHTRKHTGEKPFVCEKCGMSFGCKSGLNKHIMFKHRYDEDVQEKYWR